MIKIERLCMGCMSDNGGEEICPVCSHNNSENNGENCLNVRHVLKNRYLVGKSIEINGQGITYIGFDKETSAVVNIAEYFPTPISSRDTLTGEVTVNGDNGYFFNEGILDFIALGKKLSGLNLDAIPEVEDVFEENGTAYTIFRNKPGITLREFLLRNGGSLKWDQARPLFMPLVSVISELHANGIIHGGISPETVNVGRDGKLRLTGFAIPQLRHLQTNTNSQLFPGFAAAEQYDQGKSLSDATDVYGFAATLFRVLMGSAPPEVKERIAEDKMTIPADVVNELPKAVLVTLADALQISEDKRTRTMEEFKVNIAPALEVTSAFSAADNRKKANAKKTDKKEKMSKKENRKYMLMSAGITAGIFLLIGLVLWFVLFKNSFGDKKTGEPVEVSVSETEQTEETPVVTKDPNEITVPDFTKKDMTLEQAMNENANLNFVVYGKMYSEKKEGIIVGQKTNAGSTVKKGDTVYVILSLGSEYISIPDFSGVDKKDALLELYRSGFSFDNIAIYEKEDESVSYGCVIDTEPAANTKVNKDSKITIFISKSNRPMDNEE